LLQRLKTMVVQRWTTLFKCLISLHQTSIRPKTLKYSSEKNNSTKKTDQFKLPSNFSQIYI